MRPLARLAIAAAITSLIGCQANSAPSAARRPADLEARPRTDPATQPPRGAAAAWTSDRFTDPSRHDPLNFRYLVHMLDVRNPQKGRTIEDTVNYIEGQGENSSPTDVFSFSVIDPAHVSGYGPVGFVIEVPPESIVAMDSRDMGTHLPLGVDREDYLTWLSERYPITNPEDLLRRTARSAHVNEIVARVKPGSGARAKVRGLIWIKFALLGGMAGKLTLDLLEYFERYAVQTDLPKVNLISEAQALRFRKRLGPIREQEEKRIERFREGKLGASLPGA